MKITDGKAHKLRFSALVAMVEYRLRQDYLAHESLKEAVNRAVTPLFYAGVISQATFLKSARNPPQALLDYLPELKNFVNLAQAHQRTWAGVSGKEAMLEALVASLEQAFLSFRR